MKYCIMRNHLFVSKPGSQHSYTVNLARARKYNDLEEAKRHVCLRNERIMELERILDQYRV